MFVLFLLLDSWMLIQHINKEEINVIELNWIELLSLFYTLPLNMRQI
jgi:hypothetical protein